jgi:hypothetical protein
MVHHGDVRHVSGIHVRGFVNVSDIDGVVNGGAGNVHISEIVLTDVVGRRVDFAESKRNPAHAAAASSADG